MGARKGASPRLEEPESPRPVTTPPDGEAWFNEVRFAIYRLFAVKARGRVQPITRNGLDWTENRRRFLFRHIILSEMSAIFRDDAVESSARAGGEMSMFSFGFLSIDDHLSSTGQTFPRLRDLIAGLRSGDIAAAPILSRLDPNLSDEIRALVAHRGVSVESFLASVLMAFALDVADETWRRMTDGGESVVEDAEAGALGDLIAEAMRQTLLHGLRIEGETASQKLSAKPGRRVG